MAGEIQLNSVSLATESSSAITLGSAVSLNSAAYATTSEVQGTHTTGSITSGTTSLTVASGSGISNGDYVVGEGIAPGTTVSSGGGTTSITLSANAAATLSSDPVSFYTANKALSPGLVAGGLCRAWARVQSNGTIIGSNNVSSVTASSGSYTVNFSNAMPDTNYSVCLSLGSEQAGYYFHYLHTASTGSVLIKTQYEAGNFGTYPRSFCMAIFR